MKQFSKTIFLISLIIPLLFGDVIDDSRDGNKIKRFPGNSGWQS